MNNTITDQFARCANDVYSNFFANKKDFFDYLNAKGYTIKPTEWRGGESKKSYCYAVPEQTKSAVCKQLCDIFDIQEKKMFEDKFKQAVSGDGQELKRINVLHSSSLIALLCFYNVTKDNPLMWNINDRKICFTESKFEQKNHVAEGHDSNMDVVLEGHYADNKQQKVVLFLESKFSEYFACGQYKGISKKAYEDIYKKLNGKLGPLQIDGLDEDAETLTLYSERPAHYCGGIKQMISHYQGIVRGVLEGKNRTNTYSGYDIYLAEILFSFPFDTEKGKLKDYEELYEILAEELNKLQKDNLRFNIADNSFTYQDVFASNNNFRLNEQVRKLYFD